MAQDELDDAHHGPQFEIYTRYAYMLNTIFVVMMYSSGSLVCLACECLCVCAFIVCLVIYLLVCVTVCNSLHAPTGPYLPPGMPILLVFGCASAIMTFWVDKYLMLRFYSCERRCDR